jgi:hypothetical protein
MVIEVWMRWVSGVCKREVNILHDAIQKLARLYGSGLRKEIFG